MTQADKAGTFAALHVKGDPLVLYNIWDAGSAKAVAEAGAAAVATGSWSVAAAQGYPDGESLPLDLLEIIVGRIAATVDVPLSVDFEGGYAAAPDDVARNVSRIVAAGAIGINFEDQVVGGDGSLYGADEQSKRIAAVRRAADAAGVPLFINARTDLFLKQKDHSRHADLMPDALTRAEAYQAAGADGFFVPGLVDPALIETVCGTVSLPVNVMKMPEAPPLAELAGLGVSRISFGPGPYRLSVKAIGERAASILGTGESQ